MKVIIRNYGVGMNSVQRAAARAQAADLVRARGTSRTPLPPRDVFAQAGPRGILLSWRPPERFFEDISGWRIYKDDERSLLAEIREPNTTQRFIEATAGSTPPVTNLFISSVGKLGQESPLVAVQGQSTTEAAAPSMPPTQATYTTPYTGRNTRTGNNTYLP